jgi:hypothetical protein
MTTVTLKIVRIRERNRTRIRLSGELRSADLEHVRVEIARVGAPIILDLQEVDLVDIHGIRWLNTCQAQGVQVENCAPYICEWMYQEKLGADK